MHPQTSEHSLIENTWLVESTLPPSPQHHMYNFYSCIDHRDLVVVASMCLNCIDWREPSLYPKTRLLLYVVIDLKPMK